MPFCTKRKSFLFAFACLLLHDADDDVQKKDSAEAQI
jgi:hypothetical protein